MYIKVYEHLTPEYALEPNEPKRRIVVALLDNNKQFLDSFDYKQITNQIRFYGESKHYNGMKFPNQNRNYGKLQILENCCLILENTELMYKVLYNIFFILWAWAPPHEN